MVKALDIKLWRDLKRLAAQGATIALVVACGVAGFVGMSSTHHTLVQARDDYYRDARFADVFASVRRAPMSLRARLAGLEGVTEVRLDTVFDTQLDLPGVEQPVTGRLIGLEIGRAQGLNRLTVTTGRLPERAVGAEVVVDERFAERRGLVPGSSLTALLNGRRQTLRVVGTVLSPEYVYATRSGAPDDEWFGVLWIDAERLASAFDMQGAFNRVALRLAPGADMRAVLPALDALLEPWGSGGAVGRDRQLSARIVEDELRSQQVLGTLLPAILLAVAAFILQVVMSRQVATQRGQIAALKALGYANATIGAHYIALAVAIAAAGIGLGLLGSLWLGRSLVGLYADLFRFGGMHYRTVPAAAAMAVAAVIVAAALGALQAMASVVRLSPAQAMQPPAPPRYRPTVIERLGWGRHLPPAVTMVLRSLERRPVRAAFATAGIAAAVALQITGLFWGDAIDFVIDRQFRQVLQGDVVLDFHQPVDLHAADDLRGLPGVVQAEVYRAEPVRVHAGKRSADTVLNGRDPQTRLMRVVHSDRGAIAPSRDGVILSALLARELGVATGERIEIEFRLWHRRRVSVPVVDVAHTLMGRELYMDLGRMNRLAGDGSGANAAVVRLDPAARSAFYRAVKDTPRIAGVLDKAGMLRSFERTTATNVAVFTGVMTVFAVAMAVGIIYNAARIALSERSWELASLRVLGMTRREVSVLLLAELGIELVLALPLGAAFGWLLARALLAAMGSQDVDFPLVIEPSTYGIAALTVLAAGIVSALVVRRQIDRLDLVAALKARE